MNKYIQTKDHRPQTIDLKQTDLFLIIFLGFFLLSGINMFAQSADFPPKNVTDSQDRNQILKQLGISFPDLPLKTEDPNAPKGAYPENKDNPEGNWKDGQGRFVARSSFGLWTNYDDTPAGFLPGKESRRVGKYTPIDLLKMKDGTVIKTAGEWWAKRRPEIMKDVQEQVWGVIPPENILPKVEWSVTTSKGEDKGFAYKEKRITGIIDTSRYPQVKNIPKISAVLRVPSDAKGPVPVMVVISTYRWGEKWNPMNMYWEVFASRGWGVCIFDSDSLQPDNGAFLTSYIIGLCNKGNWRKPTDWGSLAAWGWGVSKLIDYFQTDPDVDASKIGVTGNSRYGKAALVAMAYEPRLAIAFPSCSGSLGAKMNRRHWAQDLEHSSWDKEYHWVAGNFFKWMGPLKEGNYLPRKIELCPVDAHSLLSLCAPRPVFINGGTTDSWPDPYGMYLTCVGATPVYELLGEKGLVMDDEKPKIDVGYISGDIAFRYHNGGHTDAPDWPAFFEFAGKYIKLP